MLNGIDPIIIFNFKKRIPPASEVAFVGPRLPVADTGWSFVDLPFIPIYLSEALTGVYIESEDKNVDIDTTTDALTSGGTPVVSQRPISSTIKIAMVANRDSIGVSLFSALVDFIFPKITSKEYSITYLHGAVTVFEGILHSFSINQNSNNDLYNINLEIVKPSTILKTPVPIVTRVVGSVPL